MSHDLDYFFDPHCHMFTIADIPLYETVRHVVKSVHPISGMLMGALAGTLGPSQLEKRKPLITFFEAEPEENPLRIEKEIDEALRANGIRAGTVITTPLVMDFDINGHVDKLPEQVERLAQAAKACKSMRVLPFLGVDPRRFVYKNSRQGRVRSAENTKQEVSRFLRKYKLPSKADRKDLDRLENGDILGIKMYPPLGFSPWPKEPVAQKRHLDVYEALCRRGLPLTVHCQKTSFSYVAKKEVLEFTKPKNWVQILDGLQERGKDLRLNFGHFGGDSGVDGMIWLTQDQWKSGRRPEASKMYRSSWTYQIARALKRYPETYADISAIDFDNRRNAASFLWLLAFDHTGALDRWGEHRLLDKLMWGSDYPMALGEKQRSYRDVLSSFLAAYREIPGHSGKMPKRNQLPRVGELVRSLCCDNPRAFLFGK